MVRLREEAEKYDLIAVARAIPFAMNPLFSRNSGNLSRNVGRISRLNEKGPRDCSGGPH